MKKPAFITEYEKPFDLSEIYQKSGLRYAFLSAPRDGSVMCCAFVKCRDFLHDAVRAYVTKTPCEIYGFKYDPATDAPIDMKRIRLRIKDDTKSKKELADTIKNGIALINHYEMMMGSKSKSSSAKLKDGTYVVSGPSVWLKVPILTTLYTLLFRVGEHSPVFESGNTESVTKCYKTILAPFKPGELDDEANTDLKYLSTIYKYLPAITENYKGLCGMYMSTHDPIMWDKKLTINRYHHSAGVVSLCKDAYIVKERFAMLNLLMEEMKEGKALLKVQSPYDLSAYSSYQPNQLSFAFIHSEDDVRTQCSSFTVCREQLVSAFRNKHVDADHGGYYYGDVNKAKHIHVDDEKLRLLVRVPGVLRDRLRMATHKKEMFFAKRVINYYEKYLGIPKSVISTVLIESRNGAQYGWLFTASNEWLASPVMLSLYTAIIRSAKSYMHKHLRDAENYPEPENINGKETKQLWKLLGKGNGFVKQGDSVIGVHYATVIKVLKNRKILFGERTIQQQFFIGKENLVDNNIHVGYSTRTGISSLLGGNHIDTHVTKKFKELAK